MKISGLAYVLVAAWLTGPAAASGFIPHYCLFTETCAAGTPCPSFTVEIAPVDHEPGLWFNYDARALSVQDVTPSDTPISIFVAGGYEEHVILTMFPTGEALHVRQYYRPGHGPAQDTASGQCEVL